MVLGFLPVVPMTLVSAALMIVVSQLTARSCPGAGTLARYFPGSRIVSSPSSETQTRQSAARIIN
jgi:hypothetical protein